MRARRDGVGRVGGPTGDRVTCLPSPIREWREEHRVERSILAKRLDRIAEHLGFGESQS